MFDNVIKYFDLYSTYKDPHGRYEIDAQWWENDLELLIFLSPQFPVLPSEPFIPHFTVCLTGNDNVEMEVFPHIDLSVLPNPITAEDVVFSILFDMERNLYRS